LNTFPTGFELGRFRVAPALALAPMAGTSDAPFRALCVALGATYAVAEMTGSQANLRNTKKSQSRRRFAENESPRVAQIVGATAEEIASAARFAQDNGADIVDINMGCPAKKVFKRAAGSALLADEKNVETILKETVRAVDIPVTLKFRTGVTRERNNAVAIARIAEVAGIRMLTLHGRSREDLFNGDAEYETAAAVKKAVGIPLLVNGDIDGVEKMLSVLQQTGADGAMIGRAAMGQPWLFSECRAALEGKTWTPLTNEEKARIAALHVQKIFEFYEEPAAIRFTRKHLLAYARRAGREDLKEAIVAAETFSEQMTVAEKIFDF
jgi:tRNA-dihydrouridine synthase B